ncbi:MAG TPA: hypothetical protein PJ982_12585, partial [Lacipirellulaceae bacterium]|nr:hypothetical protein [Lacipirellulaceae bacterium]
MRLRDKHHWIYVTTCFIAFILTVVAVQHALATETQGSEVRAHWAYRPINIPDLPSGDPAWSESTAPIDRFIRQAL